ncbi:unnamed protein product [Boreogadus saida]
MSSINWRDCEIRELLTIMGEKSRRTASVSTYLHGRPGPDTHRDRHPRKIKVPEIGPSFSGDLPPWRTPIHRYIVTPEFPFPSRCHLFS